MKRDEEIIDKLNSIKEDKLKEIICEIHRKEQWVVGNVVKEGIFDKTHKNMVLDFVKDRKTPVRPETINKLFIQFISSAFSYNRIRNQLRKLNREIFKNPNYPIREDHLRILAYLLDDPRLKNEEYWHPLNFNKLISDLLAKGDYHKLKIMSDYWLNHIIQILSTCPKRFAEFTLNDPILFYKKVDELINAKKTLNVYNRAENLWNFALFLSEGIRNVGVNLICDFLKECGFTEYAKMDIHMIRSMSEILKTNNCKELDSFDSFLVAQWLSEKVEMTPFRLDKILYVFGKYN